MFSFLIYFNIPLIKSFDTKNAGRAKWNAWAELQISQVCIHYGNKKPI